MEELDGVGKPGWEGEPEGVGMGRERESEGRLGWERELDDGDGVLGRDGELLGVGMLGWERELDGGDGVLGRDGELLGVGRFGRERELDGDDGMLGRDRELDGEGMLGCDGELDGEGVLCDGLDGGCGTLGGRDEEQAARAKLAAATAAVSRNVMA